MAIHVWKLSRHTTVQITADSELSAAEWDMLLKYVSVAREGATDELEPLTPSDPEPQK